MRVSNPLTSITPDVSYEWEDVTGEFKEAIKDLDVGELMHDDLFGLFEAMSAIEMMDPKMDAGMQCNRGNRAPLTFFHALEAGILKLEGVCYADQISIIDTTWACMASWFDGHSLAQTVFTNLYLDNPHLIVDKSLKSFCIAIYKLIDIANDIVNRGLVSEEEDFQPMVFGFRLNPEVPDMKAVNLLKEAEEELTRKKKVPSANVALLDALIARVRYTKLFLQALICLDKNDIDSAMLEESNRLLVSCSDLTQTLIKTIEKGSPPWYVSEVHGPVAIGFDPMVNQRLLPPTFPRFSNIKSPAEAYSSLDQLLNRLRHVSKICVCSSFQSALDLMLAVSNSCKPCIVSRSVMQMLYMPHCVRNGDIINCSDALREAAKTFINPPVLSAKSGLVNNPQAKEYVDCFLARCVRPFSGLIQLCGLNRARQRDKLAHLLEELGSLTDEAERVDVLLANLGKKCEPPVPHRECFGTWLLYYILRVMVMYLVSGFELELYSTHEYHYIYWYLYEFLYGWLVSSLAHADKFMTELDALQAETKARRRNKPKQKKKVKDYSKEITYYQAMQNICGGFFRAMLAFRKQGKIRVPYSEFDREKVRFEHRLGPFNALPTPPPVQYSEYLEMTKVCEECDSQTLYLTGSKLFHRAKSLLETLPNHDPEVAALLHMTKTNCVVLKLLSIGHKQDSSQPPHFDFSNHHHFPIIKI